MRLAPTEIGRRLVATVTERRRATIARLLVSTFPEDAWLFAVSLQKLAAASGEPPSQDWGAVVDV
ncbi:hypothetical protein GHK86_08685 [Acidimicrobiaceae bacterium USS-CC1]|uniref:MarR family transcriptional regulator n=1 Tax=Acidiferrimicrobium australe TaxID=2664430 RepID=A0ABW9QTF0_9ACTN|nr:hypothetical protein [Acidiferrimicrobium australe]